MRNPAQALAEAVRAALACPQPDGTDWRNVRRVGRNEARALRDALAAYDAWKPREDEAVVQRTVQAVRDAMAATALTPNAWERARHIARAALKAALGGDDA